MTNQITRAVLAPDARPVKNYLINGCFRVWQRGTSLAAGTGVSRYLADRWTCRSSSATVSPSRQSFALGQTAVPSEPEFFHRAVVTAGAEASEYALVSQFVEGVRTLAGRTFALSFWAKADAAKSIAVEFENYYGTGGTPSSATYGIGLQTINLTTSWQKFETTATFPSIAGKTLGDNDNDHVRMNFWCSSGSDFAARSNALGSQSITLDIAQVQLEAGPVATDFEYRPLALEEFMCRRYFQELDLSDVGISQLFVMARADGVGGSNSTYSYHQFNPPMRAPPAMSVSGTWNSAAGYAGTPTPRGGATALGLTLTSGVAGAAGEVQWLSGGKIQFDAEL